MPADPHSDCCDLCSAPLGSRGEHRVGDLQLCEPCYDGQGIEDRLYHRGFAFTHKRWHVNTDGGYRDCFQATGKVDHGVGTKIQLSTESIGTRLTRLLRREIQVGDPLFDDHIFVKTRQPDLAARLLRDTAMQSAVMDLVAEVAEFTIDHDTIRIHRVSTFALSPTGQLLRSMAIVMFHLDTLCGPADEIPRA